MSAGEAKQQKTFKQSLVERLYQAFLKTFPNDVTLATKASIVATVPEAHHGDWATNLPLQLSGRSKGNPMEIARALANNFQWKGVVKKATTAKPGFLNLHLTNEFRQRVAVDYSRSSASMFFPPASLSKEKILVEFVSANPTGPLHIGHGRWAAIGNSLANILEKVGCKVEREFYVNDHGSQIERFFDSVEAVRQGKPIPEDGYHGDYMKAFKDEAIGDPVEHLLSQQKALLDHLGVRFDRYFLESELHQKNETSGTTAIEEALDLIQRSNHAYLEDGALWLRSSAMGDDKDRVLVKADGSYTYFAVDIAYHREKIRRGFGKMINVLGADHHGYVKRLKAAVNMLSNGERNVEVVIGQLVQVMKDGEPVRMSKREGNLIALEEVAEAIGRDATLYYLTMRSASSPLEFDLVEAAKRSNDNPLYYIQYAHARIGSVLRNAEAKGIDKVGLEYFDYSAIEHPDLNVLANLMVQFPDELHLICSSYEVHHLNAFLHRVATAFHKAYATIPFIGAGDDSRTGHYLVFLKALQNLLKQGLALIGVGAPDRM